MNKYALLLVSALLLNSQTSFAKGTLQYEFVDADIRCKAPGKGNLKLVSMIYLTCYEDHVPEKGMIDNSMYQLGLTAGRMCGGAYDVTLIWVNDSLSQEQAEQEHARELNSRSYKQHETFPYQYVYASQRCN